MYLAHVGFIRIDYTPSLLINIAFYKPNSARGLIPSWQCAFLMWLCFVLCMKVLLFNPLFSDSHLECTMEIRNKFV